MFPATQYWYNAEKAALASLWCVENIDCDLAYGFAIMTWGLVFHFLVER